jgi:mono/diheme cytochrome c family protein
MKKSGFFNVLTILLLVVLVLGGVSLLSSCSSAYRYGSNGERIYFTSESSSGEPITYSGSIRMMHSITCANCHGQEGKGGRVNMMMSYFDTPNITWHVLTQEEGHSEETGEDEHEEHPPYTEETLKSAITRGINPAGEPLDDEMPRWRMSEQDLDDLVEFIKTLE